MAEMMSDEYDFIIVGGGTSGLVVACRLTEDPNIQVLVLEAGADMRNDPRVQTPAFFEQLKGTEADWGFESEPQAELNGRRIRLSQGRLLGGSSAINAQMFIPPSQTVIDAWETLGNPGWNWCTLQPYYAKSYSLQPPEAVVRENLGIDCSSTPTSGPIKVSYTQGPYNQVPMAWNDTFRPLGLKMKDDPFAGEPVGAFTPLSSINPTTGERSYAASAYYTPVANRQNLQVLTGCLVHRILFEPSLPNAIARGVIYNREGTSTNAVARREVILAAGSFQSPKILELSGIGDAKVLSTQGIDVLVDNPRVGENLQDHILCGVGFEATDGLPTLDDLVRQEPKAIEAAMTTYTTTKSGPFSSAGVSSCAFLPVMDFVTDEGGAKLQEILHRHNSTQFGSLISPLKEQYHIVTSILEDVNDASALLLAIPTQVDVADSPIGLDPGKFVSLGATLSLPFSRGSVHINSPDPMRKPTIDPRLLSNPIDMEVFARHVQYLETIAASKSFCTILKEGGRRRDPNAAFMTLSNVKEHIRSRSYSMWHPTSTCSMMPREIGGVVDHRLIVYGTSNLRVVDASVIPLIPRGNIQSSVYAVAERAADLIKADCGLDMAP